MYIGKGYIALIHQYQNNGYNIVMDVYSGAVHVVDELCYDVIAKLSEENEAHTAMTLKEPCVLKGLKKELGQKYEESEIEDALSDVIELLPLLKLHQRRLKAYFRWNTFHRRIAWNQKILAECPGWLLIIKCHVNPPFFYRFPQSNSLM